MHRSERSSSTNGKTLFAIDSAMEQQELIEKIRKLPQDRIAEVADFVESQAREEQSSTRINLHQALTD